MTFVLTVNTRETVWLLADRRLSFGGGRKPIDDARKIFFLETRDARAIFGYSGLGATASGIEPSDWMSRVLRGQNLLLEPSLDRLAAALKGQLPNHLKRFPPGAPRQHNVLVNAFVGEQPRVYSIDLVLRGRRSEPTFQYTRWMTRPNPGVEFTPRVAAAGSGVVALRKVPDWFRTLLSVVDAHDADRVSADAVASHLASLNVAVHGLTEDGSVGPRSLVAWRYRKGGSRGGGGASESFIGTSRDPAGVAIPSIGLGMDMIAVAEALMPITKQYFEDRLAGRPPAAMSKEGIEAELAKLPTAPDEQLR